MRVTIDIKESIGTILRMPGLFNMLKAEKTYPIWIVETHIELSEEERAIITKNNLWGKILFVRQLPSEHFSNMSAYEHSLIGDVKQIPTSIKDLFENPPYQVKCYDPVSAKEFAHKLETEHLPLLKNYLNGSATPAKPKTFEL